MKSPGHEGALRASGMVSDEGVCSVDARVRPTPYTTSYTRPTPYTTSYTLHSTPYSLDPTLSLCTSLPLSLSLYVPICPWCLMRGSALWTLGCAPAL